MCIRSMRRLPGFYPLSCREPNPTAEILSAAKRRHRFMISARTITRPSGIVALGLMVLPAIAAGGSNQLRQPDQSARSLARQQ